MERNNSIEIIFSGRIWNNKYLLKNEDSGEIEVCFHFEKPLEFLVKNGLTKKRLGKSNLQLIESETQQSFLLSNVEDGILPKHITNKNIDYLEIFNIIKKIDNPRDIIFEKDLSYKYDFSDYQKNLINELKNYGFISIYENLATKEIYFIFSDLLIDFANDFFEEVKIERIN